MLKMYDISGFQASAAPSGADGIFVKASEGSAFTSGVFSQQMTSARSKSEFQGAYHFARPEESSGASQADRLLALAHPFLDKLVLWLDLEISQLTQSATNLWARDFSRRIRLKAPKNRLGLYMGAGYATNGTGKGLKDFFDLWWYPQYPTVYQLHLEGEEFWRAMNRTHYTPDRAPIAAASSMWPNTFNPWLPAGLTCGWTKPDIWQFTDNHTGGIDASISPLTVAQLMGTGDATTKEDQWFQATSS